MAFVFSFIAIFLLIISGTVEAKTYGAKICDKPGLDCRVVGKGQTWHTMFADENERDLVMRINRVNTPLRSGMTIAVPEKLSGADPLDFAPFRRQINPPGTKTVIVSLSDLAFGAYDAQGNLLYWGPVSGGKNYCPDVGRGCRTAKGTFAIYQKGGAGCKSSKFPINRGGAPMPYCMFFSGGFAMHGSYEVPGYHASHGCVRMYTKDAQWLNQEFSAGEYRVSVIVNN